MEHKPVEKLRSVAEVHELSQGFLSRRERLERWAEVLSASQSGACGPWARSNSSPKTSGRN